MWPHRQAASHGFSPHHSNGAGGSRFQPTPRKEVSAARSWVVWSPKSTFYIYSGDLKMRDQSFHSHLIRLCAGVLILALAVAPTLTPTVIRAQGKSLAGVTLSLIDNPDGQTDAVKQLEAQFEQETGAKLNIEVVPPEQVEPKIS